MKKIKAFVLRGSKKGTLLTPHRSKDGCFRVSVRSNRAADAIKVDQEDALEAWILKGYGVRMSGPNVAPSIYTARSLIIE